MATCPAGHDSADTDYCDVCGLVIAPPDPLGAAAAGAGSTGTGSTGAAPGTAEHGAAEHGAAEHGTAEHGVPAPAPPGRVGSGGASGGASLTPTCANCGAPRDGRFCEECGHDASGPAPVRSAPPARSAAVETASGAADRSASAAAWSAVVGADRSWFDEVRRRDGPDAGGLEFPRYHPELRFELSGAQVAIGRRSRSRGTDPDIDLSGPQLDPGVSAQHALLVARADGGWEIVDLGSTNGTSVNDDPTTIAPHTPVALADGDRVHLGAWTTITVGSTA